MLTSIISKEQALVIANGEIYTIPSSHHYFNKICEAIKAKDEKTFFELYSASPEEEAIEVLKENKNVTIRDGKVFYKDIEIQKSLSDRIIDMQVQGFSIDHMILFLENLYQNPSRTAVYELYDFMENTNIPITDDGCFLSYKSVHTYNGPDFTDKMGKQVVKGDLVDKYSSTYRNNVGDVIEMQRNEVDDNRDRECSYGAHTGGLDYVTKVYHSNGDTVILTKTNPKDVVSVPRDYNAQKLRTCKYEVVSIYKTPLNKAVYTNDEELVSDPTLGQKYRFSVDVDDLRIGDQITFLYNGKNRHIVVDDYDDEYVSAILDENDPSYDEDEEISFRQFCKDKMSNIFLY